ncbi:hypothetical protein D9619_004485 [Psilocybe cf. subviscida]|uniref:NACHT domain-containing protein n=1 Tax=Psilocybe cf. subviscida TaxID=2480587 RepID=A0A8H5BRM2_9AGAR|nr:hypothetical protein D9619_004485 [Psilocybe cf. subviscida]
MAFFKGKFRKLKTRLSPSRPHSAEPSINEGDQGPSRAPTPSPSTLGRKSDTAVLFTLDHGAEFESKQPASFLPGPTAELDNDLPKISVEEAPVSPTITILSAGPTKHRQQTSFHNYATFVPVHLPEPGPTKRRFAQSGASQQDIVALHVAYVVQDSTGLQELILEMVRINDELDFKDVLKPAVSFTTDLVAALDMKPTPDGAHEAISSFLAAMKAIDLNESPDKALRTVQRSVGEIKRAHPDLSGVYQKDSSCFSTIASSVLGVTLPLFEILKDASSMFPVPLVQPLIVVVAGFLKAANQASNNFEWMRWLAATAAEYIVRIAVICPREIDTRWTKAIEALDGKLSKIVDDAAEFSRRSVISRFLYHGGDQGDIMRMKDDLRAAIDLFNMEVQINIKIDLDSMSRNIESLLLENLPRLPSHKISHDRYFRASREKEIRDTLEWVEADDGERFLWIHGAAGVGKSTYARRLLDHIKEEGMLGAFAYFAIGIDSDPKDLVRMMARELASLHPGCRHDVVRAIKQCSGVHQCLEEYIIHYLVRPISTLSYSGPLVIILDALDEWAYREEFLSALVRKVRLPGTTALKFVMTSRYSTGIDSIVSSNARTRELTPVSETICREYFDERFQTINWYGRDPGSQEFDKLVELADGLLIWAATVCTLVSVKRPNKRPNQILDDILTSSNSVARGKRMEELYELAMKRIFPDEDEEIKQSRSDILLAMAALKEALPLSEFALLVDVLPEFVNDICIGLRALQTRGAFDESKVQPAIKIFHASFIDYFGTLQEARTVVARHCVDFFKRSQNAEEPANIGANLFRQAELYIGKHFADHILEAPTDLQSQAIAHITTDDLRMWAGWSLAQLMVIGEENGFPASSNALRTMAESLLDGNGVIYPPESMIRNEDQILTMVSSFQKVLILAGLDWGSPISGIEEPIQYEHDARRWVHVINTIAVGFLQIQKVKRFDADSPDITSLESTIGHLDAISKAFDTDCPLSVLENLALALEERFRYKATVEDLERAIVLHASVQQRMSDEATGYMTCLSNFAQVLHTRFQYVGSHVDDLDRSISLLREALARGAFIHHQRPTALDNLGVALHTRYLLRDLEEPSAAIDEIVDLHQEAFRLRSTHSSHSPLLLNNLSSALQSKFEQQKDAKVLETAFFYALQAASANSLGNLERSMYTATFAHAVHLISQARLDPCSDVPEEHLHLTKTDKFTEVYSFKHPSHRHLDHAAVARDLYREASYALPLAAPSRWSVLNRLGLAQQARATMNEELDLRYADEAIFLHHLIKRRQHESHPMRILSEKYLQRAYETLQVYNIPCPDPDISLEKISEAEEEMSDSTLPLYTSGGLRCSDLSSQGLYDTRFLHHLRNYVKDSGEPVILYRFSSEAFDEIWRPCAGGDVDSDGESVVNGVPGTKEDTLETIPVLWNLMCSAKYLGIWGLPERLLSEGPTRLSGRIYRDVVACFETRKPWEFEHQFIYVKDPDGSRLGQDVPKNQLAPLQQLGGEFIRNPLEFAITFYLASQYQASPSLRDLSNVISTHQHEASEITGKLAEALLEIIPFISKQRESVNTLLASCGSKMKTLEADAGDAEGILASMTTSLREGIDGLKATTYPQDGSSSSQPRFADLVLDVERFLDYSSNGLAFGDIFHRAPSIVSIPLVLPLLNILLGVCDRYFRSKTRYEEEIHFIMLVTLAQLSSGIAFVSSDGRYPVDGRLYHAIRILSESLQHLLDHSQSVDDLAGPFRALIHDFRRHVYDRSQLARTFVLCMACHGIRLWDRGWAHRWYYAKTTEKLESDYSAESDLESNDEDETTPGAKMRLKLKRNLRLGARRKLKTAQPVQLKQKKPKENKDEEPRNGEEGENGQSGETEGVTVSEDITMPESVTMPAPQPFDDSNELW